MDVPRGAPLTPLAWDGLCGGHASCQLSSAPRRAVLCPTGQGVPVPTGAAVLVVPRREEAGAGGQEVPRGDRWLARRDQIKRLLGEMRGVLTGHLNISPALSERQREEIAFKKKKKDAKGDYDACFHLSLGMGCAAECAKGAGMEGPARGDVFWCIQQPVVAVPWRDASQRGK